MMDMSETLQRQSLSDRLRNWARWARGGQATGHCGSAEGRFRANWRQWLTLQEIGVPDPIDPLDAITVETAWKHCSHKTKVILKLRYIWRAPDDLIARKARIKAYHLNAAVSRARYELKETLYLLTVDKTTGIKPPTADTPRKR